MCKRALTTAYSRDPAQWKKDKPKFDAMAATESGITVHPEVIAHRKEACMFDAQKLMGRQMKDPPKEGEVVWRQWKLECLA